MRRITTSRPSPAIIVAVLALITALAGTAIAGPNATTSGVKQKVKKLTQQVRQLQQQLDALANQPGTQGPVGPQGPEGPAGPQGPAGLSTGPAGGDLTGNYPNPVLRAGAVAGGTGGEITDNTLTDADLAGSAQFSGAAAGGDLAGTYPDPTIETGAVGAAEIATGAVRSAEILNGSVAQQDLAPEAWGARAYAFVSPSTCTGTPATCTPQQSKGISSVTRVNTGFYCVTAPGIDSGVTPAAVTVEFNDTASRSGNTSAMTDESFNCGPSGKGFAVATERQPNILVDQGGIPNNGTAAGPAAEADNVAFTIVIP